MWLERSVFTMRKLARKQPGRYLTHFERHVEELLEKIRREVPAESAHDYVVINAETGEYVLEKTRDEAIDAFDARWPDASFIRSRLDGRPFSKWYGRRS